MQNKQRPMPWKPQRDGRRKGLWRYNTDAMQIVRWSAEYYSKLIGPFGPAELRAWIATEFPLADWSGTTVFRSLERLHAATEVSRIGRGQYEWNDAHWASRLRGQANDALAVTDQLQ